MIIALRVESPVLTVIMPKPNDTEKYPSAIGIPCVTPFLNVNFTIFESFRASKLPTVSEEQSGE